MRCPTQAGMCHRNRDHTSPSLGSARRIPLHKRCKRSCRSHLHTGCAFLPRTACTPRCLLPQALHCTSQAGRASSRHHKCLGLPHRSSRQAHTCHMMFAQHCWHKSQWGNLHSLRTLSVGQICPTNLWGGGKGVFPQTDKVKHMPYAAAQISSLVAQSTYCHR